jgi:hypothetical protein
MVTAGCPREIPPQFNPLEFFARESHYGIAIAQSGASPMHFVSVSFTINIFKGGALCLEAAKQIGLTIPSNVLARANKVIR